MSEEKSRRRRPPSLFWPLILIGAGVIFLLANFGYIDVNNVWTVLWRFWPVLLILVGIDIVFGSRSTAGAIISALLGLGVIAAVIALIWFAPQIPALRSQLETSRELHYEQKSHALGNIDEANVTIDVSAGDFELSSLEDSGNLIEANVRHYGELVFDVSERSGRADVNLDVSRRDPTQWFTTGRESWDIKLHPAPSYQIEMEASSGTLDIDLGRLQVTEFMYHQSSGRTTLALPATGQMDCEIQMSSGNMDIRLPQTMEARIVLDRSSGNFDAGSRFKLVRGSAKGDGTWQTANWDTAADQVAIQIEMSSGNVTVR
jgi:hypothetical protein